MIDPRVFLEILKACHDAALALEHQHLLAAAATRNISANDEEKQRQVEVMRLEHLWRLEQ